jgi:hypothetical protein
LTVKNDSFTESGSHVSSSPLPSGRQDAPSPIKPARGSGRTIRSTNQSLGDWLQNPAVLLSLIALVTFVVYVGTLSFQFVWDDRPQIVNNPIIQRWKDAPRAFVSDLWYHSTRTQIYYRPLFTCWSMLNYSLFALKPWGWHLGAILVHILAVISVFFWLASWEWSMSSFYSFRLLAGALITATPLSQWFLVFSLFFLSLAMAERYSELVHAEHLIDSRQSGRGYVANDRELILLLGVGSTFASVVILSLYVHSQDVGLLYRNPQPLLLISPIILYWMSHIWLRAHRGELNEDPVTFAIRDRLSYAVGAAAALAIAASILGIGL